ncbi:MAG: NADH-quinone oxidoreductase subunit L [Magnetococcales bacterium]|nr:NADH-quinone oxidoreductase subunit L [Magnetococcales bacterium]
MSTATILWTQEYTYPLLAALQLLPLLGALLVYRLKEANSTLWVAQVVVVAELFLALVIFGAIDTGSPLLQFSERLHLDGVMVYYVAVDGLAVLFILVTALLSSVLAFYGLVRGLKRPVRLSSLILATEASLMVMLVTQNLLVFILASGVELLLVGHMLNHWAISPTANRTVAMNRFLQFQIIGLLMFAAGVFILTVHYANLFGHWSFELADLQRVAGDGGRFQSVVFFLLFYGLGVRIPIFPLHGWLPPVAFRGMVALAPTILLGIKVGIYGMVRFVLPLTIGAVHTWQSYVVGVAMVGVFYPAILAMFQNNLRLIMAFAVVSHTGLIVVGLFSLTPEGLQGATLLAVNFGLAATVMLTMIGFVHRRFNTTDLNKLAGRGLFNKIPFIALVFLIGALSILGMPGTPGFDAVHLVLEAAIRRFGALLAIATALGSVAAAAFLLRGFQRAFLTHAAAATTTVRDTVEPTRPMEYLVGALVVGALLAAGFHIDPWLDLIDAPTRALAAGFGTP